MQNRTPCEIPCEAGYYAVNYVKTKVQHIRFLDLVRFVYTLYKCLYLLFGLLM